MDMERKNNSLVMTVGSYIYSFNWRSDPFNGSVTMKYIRYTFDDIRIEENNSIQAVKKGVQSIYLTYVETSKRKILLYFRILKS